MPNAQKSAKLRPPSLPARQAPPLALELNVRARPPAGVVAFVTRQLRAAHSLLRSPVRELSVAVVGDTTMARLHEQFMGVAGPTDVLTFELEHDGRGRVVAGEVVICLAEARRQARRRNVPLQHEALLYCLHGLLHLMGFDDRTETDYRKMHRTEDMILTKLGIGQVFAKRADREAPIGIVGLEPSRRGAR